MVVFFLSVAIFVGITIIFMFCEHIITNYVANSFLNKCLSLINFVVWFSLTIFIENVVKVLLKH